MSMKAHWADSDDEMRPDCTICGYPASLRFRFRPGEKGRELGCIAAIHDPYADAFHRTQVRAFRRSGILRASGRAGEGGWAVR